MRDFVDARRGVAATILSLKGGPASVDDKADDILGFFTTIGLLARRRTVDLTMVWALFQYPLHGYWLVAKESIARRQRKDPTLYDD